MHRPLLLIMLAAGTAVIACGTWLWLGNDSSTPADTAAASPAKFRSRPSLPTRDVTLSSSLAAVRGTTRASLRAWAKRLDDSTLTTLLDQCLSEMVGNPDLSAPHDIRLLFTVLAMESGKRDLDGVLMSFRLPPDPGECHVTSSLKPDLFALVLAGHAENDPEDAWKRLTGYFESANRPMVTSTTSPGVEVTLADGTTVPETFNVGSTSVEPWRALLGALSQSPSSIASTRHIFQQWSERDPAHALLAIESLLSEEHDFSGRRTAAIESFARFAPPEMLAGLRDEIERPRTDLAVEDRVPLLGDIPIVGPLFEIHLPPQALSLASGWALRDFDAARDWVSTLNYDNSDETFLLEIARRSPALVESLPESSGTELRIAIAEGWLGHDPRRSLDLLRSLNDPSLAASSLNQWVNSSDVAAWPVPGTQVSDFSRDQLREIIRANLSAFDLPEDALERRVVATSAWWVRPPLTEDTEHTSPSGD